MPNRNKICPYMSASGQSDLRMTVCLLESQRRTFLLQNRMQLKSIISLHRCRGWYLSLMSFYGPTLYKGKYIMYRIINSMPGDKCNRFIQILSELEQSYTITLLINWYLLDRYTDFMKLALFIRMWFKCYWIAAMFIDKVRS